MNCNPLSPEYDARRVFVIEYGRFSVYHDPLVHQPYGLYRVYIGGKLIGAQISYPSKPDCEWLFQQRHGVLYALPSPDPVNAADYLRGGSYRSWISKRNAA